MKRRIARRVGDVVAIHITGEKYAFGLVLKEPLMAFFDFIAATPNPDVPSLVRQSVAFKIWVMNRAVTSGIWPIVGHVDLSERNQESPTFFKVDRITGRLTATKGGTTEWPIGREECKELERAAVWDPEHVVSRLEDHFAGRPNKWVESLRCP